MSEQVPGGDSTDGTPACQSESAAALPSSAVDLLGVWGESFNLFLLAFIYLDGKGFEDETGCVCAYSVEHNRVLLHAGNDILSRTVTEMNPD